MNDLELLTVAQRIAERTGGVAEHQDGAPPLRGSFVGGECDPTAGPGKGLRVSNVGEPPVTGGEPVIHDRHQALSLRRWNTALGQVEGFCGDAGEGVGHVCEWEFSHHAECQNLQLRGLIALGPGVRD